MTGLSHLLALHGVVAYALVGTVAFAEAALFVGFVLPEETAVLLGGSWPVSTRWPCPRWRAWLSWRRSPGIRWARRWAHGTASGCSSCGRCVAGGSGSTGPAGICATTAAGRCSWAGSPRSCAPSCPASPASRTCLPPLPAVQRHRRAAVGDRVHPARLPRRRVLHEGGEDRRPGLPRVARPHRAGRVRGLAAGPPAERGEAERDRGAGPPP